ncbi:MAG: DUF4337 family protein [Candidatus Aquilonibacter sp.]
MTHTAARPRADRLIPFFTAIVAVLAALGTLYSHHRSIQALALRNDAVLLTQKASDQYQYYQSKQLKVTLYRALKLPKDATTEERSSLTVYSEAKKLEEQADRDQDRAEALLKSFETLEIATTLFEISIAFASISALMGARLPIWLCVALSASGIITGIIGYLQAY